MNRRSLTADEFLAAKRERRRLKRLAKLQSAKKKRRDLDREHRIALYTSETLKVLTRYIPVDIKTPNTKAVRISVPETFSIIDDPESALRTIYRLAAVARRVKLPRELTIDHSKLESFDLASEEILDLVAIALRNLRKRSRKGLNLKGTLPSNPTADRFIKAVGIIKNLELKPWYLEESEESKIRILRVQSYKALLKASEQTPSERGAMMLVDYFNECLELSNYELTPAGRHELANYAGEVLDNANEHSGSDDWFLVGYLDLANKRNCELVIFNLGKSFAQTFLDLPHDHYTRKLVHPFVERHQEKGFFRRGWEPENLLTVVGLQGKISSKNFTSDGTRGNGTVDLVSFFQRVHDATQSVTKPQMVILSGRTYIKFDGKYRMAADASGRPVIAFNPENSLESPPDRRYVRCLDTAFPGTIVAIRFPVPDTAVREIGAK